MTAELLIAFALLCQGGGPVQQKACASQLMECVGLNNLGKTPSVVNDCLKKQSK